MSVGLVIVSHSAELARGVVALAGQMAPDVRVLAAGGGPDGGVGTDFAAVTNAMSAADCGSGVVLLYDVGSARMVADMAVEALAEPSTAVVVEAPLVEGAVAAAVAAQGGSSLDEVVHTASSATGAQPSPAGESNAEPVGEERAQLTLTNEVGLHARPAALLARSVTGLQADVTVELGEQQANAVSVLEVMSLGARQGDVVSVRATGTDARQAVERICDLAKRGFDE